jgi:hypothetical protein
MTGVDSSFMGRIVLSWVEKRYSEPWCSSSRNWPRYHGSRYWPHSSGGNQTYWSYHVDFENFCICWSDLENSYELHLVIRAPFAGGLRELSNTGGIRELGRVRLLLIPPPVFLPEGIDVSRRFHLTCQGTLSSLDTWLSVGQVLWFQMGDRIIETNDFITGEKKTRVRGKNVTLELWYNNTQ